MYRHLLVLALFAGLGCARQPEVTRVWGHVTLDGAPLDGLRVLFWPSEDLYLGCFSSNEMDAEGLYDIYPDLERGQGASGNYKMVILEEPKPPVLVQGVLLDLHRVPKPYRSKELTPLHFFINPGENHLDPVHLTSQQP